MAANALRILPYLKPFKGYVVATVVIVILVTFTTLLTPWPIKILIDSVLGDEPLPAILNFNYFRENRFTLMVVVVGSGFCVVLLQSVLNVIKEYVNTTLKLKITLSFRGDLFQHAQRLSLAYHDSNYSGKLVYLLNNQADAVAGLLMTVPLLVQNALTFVGMFAVLIVIDLQLALTALIVLPFLIYLVSSYAARIQGPLHHVKDMESQTLSMIQEAMSMLRVVVAFGREGYEWRRFHRQGKQAIDARVNVTVRQTVFELSLNLIMAAGMAVAVGLAAAHILEGTLTVGQLMVVIAYIASIYQSLGTISSTVGSLQDQIISLNRAFALLDTEPDVEDKPGATELTGVSGEIVFDNVHYSYDGENEALSGVRFSVQAGEYVAIVGPTGAGKTTLVSLIPRFYDPSQGTVYIDGRDIRSCTLKSLRRQVSIVGQEPLLFVGSIEENIRYGRLDASEAELISAAKAAKAHEFIMSLPQKYKTTVGERGAGLSGGERQRIAVARAFLKDAPILILDEPTAFIDVRTEADVLEALRHLRRGRTTFMISHRITTIRDADRILVLNKGQIVETGTHAELVTNNGIYQQFNVIQAEQNHESEET